LAQAEIQKKSGSSEAGSKAKLNVDRSGGDSEGIRSGRLLQTEKSRKGNPLITSTYQGATYYASKADKSEFDKNPSKYVPQYGGFAHPT